MKFCGTWSLFLERVTVTHSRKSDLIAQKCEIALLLPAHCAFYWELNGTKITGIRASVVEIWLHLCQQLRNGSFEKNTLQFQRSNFPYTIARTLSVYVYYHVIICHTYPHGCVARWCLALCGGTEEPFLLS